MMNAIHKRRSRAAVIAAVLAMVSASFAIRAFSDEGVFVAATVGSLSKPPFVRSISPALSPITVARGSSQTVSVTVEDPDSTGGDIAYTVSV